MEKDRCPECGLLLYDDGKSTCPQVLCNCSKKPNETKIEMLEQQITELKARIMILETKKQPQVFDLVWAGTDPNYGKTITYAFN